LVVWVEETPAKDVRQVNASNGAGCIQEWKGEGQGSYALPSLWTRGPQVMRHCRRQNEIAL
jgi:hypothetical protein